MRANASLEVLENQGIQRANSALRADAGRAPLTRCTSFPPEKSAKVGRLRISKRCDNSGCSSELIFTTVALPFHSLESSSNTGCIMRQGPHHSAQKSAKTGLSCVAI